MTKKRQSSNDESRLFINVETYANGNINVSDSNEKNDIKYFYNDPQTINELRLIIGKKVKDIKWFFDDINSDPSTRKYYPEINEKDNKLVIDTFCKSKNITTSIGYVVIEQIRKYFYNKYKISMSKK